MLRTADALTPGLTAHFAAATLALFVAIYAFIFCFGVYYIVRIVRRGLVIGNVLTVWNGHVIQQTHAPAALPVHARRRDVLKIRSGEVQ